jgi:hypothetical protein
MTATIDADSVCDLFLFTFTIHTWCGFLKPIGIAMVIVYCLALFCSPLDTARVRDGKKWLSSFSSFLFLQYMTARIRTQFNQIAPPPSHHGSPKTFQKLSKVSNVSKPAVIRIGEIRNALPQNPICTSGFAPSERHLGVTSQSHRRSRGPRSRPSAQRRGGADGMIDTGICGSAPGSRCVSLVFGGPNPETKLRWVCRGAELLSRAELRDSGFRRVIQARRLQCDPRQFHPPVDVGERDGTS